MPTFGQTIRGARLGYHWSEKHGAMIRISDASASSWEVELCPPDQLPVAKRKDNPTHRCWWEGENVLEHIEPLKGIKLVKRPVRIVIGDDGRLIG